MEVRTGAQRRPGRPGLALTVTRRRARHLRPSRHPRLLLVSLVTTVTVLGVVSGIGLLRIEGGPSRIRVTVAAARTRRAVSVPERATVADALRAAQVDLRPGRLLSVVTGKVLEGARVPAGLVVNGRPAAAATRLHAGDTLEVSAPEDIIEDVLESGDQPPPPEPDVISGLWHPGRVGGRITRKGAVSGEVVASGLTRPPLPPVPVTEKLVALTFDDGPWPTTPEVLRILRDKNVKATFCVVTRQLVGPRLATAKAALADGNHLCNHTVNHDEKLPTKPQKTIDDEIIGADAQLRDRLGLHPTYFRPPGGSLGPAVVATARAQGHQVLLWTVDTKDYTKPPPEAIVSTAMSEVKPGAVILMHDGGGDRSHTIAALPILIDQLRAAGYQFVLPDAVEPVPAPPDR